MKNELQIKPLLKYDVYLTFLGQPQLDTFTAEHYEVIGDRTVFYRTGNTVREYRNFIDKIVVTPADAE